MTLIEYTGWCMHIYKVEALNCHRQFSSHGSLKIIQHVGDKINRILGTFLKKNLFLSKLCWLLVELKKKVSAMFLLTIENF